MNSAVRVLFILGCFPSYAAPRFLRSVYGEGPGYKSAVHYWPLNHTTTQRTLLDIRGHKPGMTYNGVRMTYTDQLGATISLDGRDEYVVFMQINGTHVEDPGLCKNGLTVAFWLKFHGGSFIMSSGRFEESDEGPGFRFLCRNCQEGQPKSGRRFLLELSTRTEVWRITLDRLPEAWLHLAFVWKREVGLKLYKNGRLWKTAEKSQSTGRMLPSDSPNNIILARPNSPYKLDNYGKFEIAHLVLWDSERSAYDVEVAFLTVLAKTLSSAICCLARRDDPCMKDACLDGCENFDEKHDCICPDLKNPRCDRKDECRDRIPECAKLAKRGECTDRKSYMRQQCRRTCQMCSANGSTPSAAESFLSPSPTHFPPNRDTLPTSGAGDATEISSSTSSRLSKSKEPTPLRNALSTPASVHTVSSSARLRSISGENIITPTRSKSTLLPLITAATPTGGSGGSVALKNSETPSPSTYAGRSSAAFSSRSVSNIKSDLRDVITSDVPTPVVASKRFRLSYSTGVESGASSLSTPHATTKTTTSTTTISTLNSLSTTAQPPPKTHKCQVGSSGKLCVCLNCQAGENCCTDEIHNTSLENGVLVAIRSITADEFISRMDFIRSGLADVVLEACSDKHCAVEVEDTKSRRKRSAENSDGSDGNSAGGPAAFSGVEPNSPQTLNSSRVVGAVVVIFEFTQKKAPARGLNASFFVQTTSQLGGVNTTGVLNGTVLFGILEEQASAVERRLNLSLLPISKWRRNSGARFRSTSVAAQETVTTAVFPDDTTTPTVTALAQDSTKKMSQTTLILIITAGCLGFLALLVLAFYLGKYFSRKMNGEFVPGKIYHSSDESSNPDLLPEFVDPSVPRITDVPHKATRGQSSANSTSGGQSSGRAAAKKQKKPMGVKITYKPPKWD